MLHQGESYIPFPSDISSINQSSDGQINELSLTIFNLDNIVSALVEDPFGKEREGTISLILVRHL